jgi:hypothetical protein
MNKLKLQLDALSVESFDTSCQARENGTVLGEQATNTCPGCPTCAATCAYTCDDATCPNCPTCAASCNGTCAGNTCWDSCGRTCWDSCGGTCIDIQYQ